MFIATDYTSNEIRAIFIKNGTLKLKYAKQIIPARALKKSLV
tara:strand:- start:144 stop:269 length:126 start_codon:yes stop_codon:yes gene_type:complete